MGQRRLNQLTVLLLLALVALLLPAQGAAQTGGGYDLTWNTVDGGGITFTTGGSYQLGATSGQADAGTLSGSGYTLYGGFWVGGGGGAGGYHIYLPMMLRNG